MRSSRAVEKKAERVVLTIAELVLVVIFIGVRFKVYGEEQR